MDTRTIASEYRLVQWSQALQERKATGESIKEFCRNKGVSRNTYFYWQRRLRAVACEHLAKYEPAQKPVVRPHFAEVMVCEPSAALSVPAEAASQLRIEVSGVCITADSTYPTDKLAALLRELAQPC